MFRNPWDHSEVTSASILSEFKAGKNLKRAIEVVGNRELLSILAKNSFGITILAIQYGDNPEFARALLSNDDIMYDHCKNKAAINKVLTTFEQFYIETPDNWKVGCLK